ncbi:Putative FABR092Cp [Rhizopus microsporus]|nr:Putative FABR092Cp [Rhizopus microsporus]
MEEENHHMRSYLGSTHSGDYVLQIDPESTSSTPPQKLLDLQTRDSDVEVCYPYQDQSSDQHSTIDVDSLNNYLKDPPEPDNNYLEKHQLTAKLDDLLDSNSSSDKIRIARKYSLYGENIQDPYLIDQAMDRCTFYSAELGSIENKSFRQLLVTKPPEAINTVAELLTNTTNWWLDICAPSNEEMRSISKIFRIHPLTTEDIQAQESREKCEIFQHYMFVSFRTFNQDFNSPNYLDAINFYIIVFRDGVLTFHFQDSPHPRNVRRRIHQLKDFIKVTPEWINYALIDNITDGFAPLIQHTELEVDSIDDLVLVLNGSEQNDMLRRIGSCRKTVMQLIRLLGPKADVLRSLIKRYEDKAKEMEYNNMRALEPNNTGVDSPPEHDEVKAHHDVTLYLGDIQDHIITMLQNVSHYDLILGRAHRNYIGQITIELSQAGNTTNEVINRLTFFATIIVPLNLVGGLFGMNVHVPGQSEDDLTWFFWIVMGMLIYVVVMMAIGKRTGFL